MILRLLFTVSILSSFFLATSCGEEEAPYKGEVVFAGSYERGGKEYFVIAYGRTDTEDQLDNQPDIYTYFVSTQTIDAHTGKVVYETEHDVSESGGDFVGAGESYLFFSSNEGLFAIPVFSSGKVLTPQQLQQRIVRINPKLQGKIASLAVNSDRQLEVKLTNADLFFLDPKTLKARVLNTNSVPAENEQLRIIQWRYTPQDKRNLAYNAMELTDTSALFMSQQEGSAIEKQVLSLSIYSPDNGKYGYLEPVDNTVFLRGGIFGAKDSVAFVQFYTDLSANGVLTIGAYDWAHHAFVWKHPAASLFEQGEFLHFTTAWSADGSAFLVWGTDKVSLIDAKTGKRRWEL